ncbi:MAG: hypothetical protein IJK06_12110 [Clostridia bacterium]|nr:hypothetical protein [Clostridia bacterium]
MKRLCCLILAALLLYSAAGAETLRLKPVESPVVLPAEMAGEALQPREYLGISPDGKTMLTYTVEEVPLTEEEIAAAQEKAQEKNSKVNSSLPGRKSRKSVPSTKTVYHLCLVRDGEMIPVAENLEFGAGDPNQYLDKFKSLLTSFPGVNGLSWSEDGRYVALSEYHFALEMSPASRCVPVIDTVSNEIWMAESYGQKPADDNYGYMWLSAMSRDGQYVYYLVVRKENENKYLCFCRTATADGSREILCRTPYRQDTGYQPASGSNLVEAADGSWFLSGIYGSGNNRMNGIVLIRFRPSGEKWTADVLSTMIPGAIGASRFVYSPATGYGLMVARNMKTTSAEAVSVAEEVSSMYSAPLMAMNRINLLRFHPDEGTLFDAWYMRKTGDAVEDMEMVPAQDFLIYVQALAFSLSPEVPEGIDPAEEMRNPTPTILNVCMSPDGQQALLAVRPYLAGGNDGSMELYLLKPDTMELRHVALPANTISLNIAAGTPYSRAFLPGIEWNPDGTIVIHTNDNTIGFFNLVTE